MASHQRKNHFNYSSLITPLSGQWFTMAVSMIDKKMLHIVSEAAREWRTAACGAAVGNWRRIDNVSVMNDGASSPAVPVKEPGECCWSKSLMALTDGSRWGLTGETNEFLTQSTFSIRAVTVTRREQVWGSFQCCDCSHTGSKRPYLYRTGRENTSVDVSILLLRIHLTRFAVPNACIEMIIRFTSCIISHLRNCKTTLVKDGILVRYNSSFISPLF